MRVRLPKLFGATLLCCACGGEALSFEERQGTGGEPSSGGGPSAGGTGGGNGTGGGSPAGGTVAAGGVITTGGVGGDVTTGGTGSATTGGVGGTGGTFECDLWEYDPEIPAIACGGLCGFRQCWTPDAAGESFGLPVEESNGECPPAKILKDPPEEMCARTALCEVEPTEEGLCCYSVRSCFR